jgi:transposase
MMSGLTRSKLFVTQRQRGDVAEFKRRIKAERDALQRDKYRAVTLALQGRRAPAIAKTLGRSRRAVQDWVYTYRDGGIDELLPGKRTGQPTKLQRDQEARFRTRLEAGPTEADGVCTLRGKDVVRILESEFQASYTLDGAYALLHRLRYSCLSPRPRHEKNEPVVVQKFKDQAPLL